MLGSVVPRVITPLVLVIVAAMRRSERIVVDALERANAGAPDGATALPGLWGLRKLMLRRLIWGGAIGTVPDHRYYLDLAGYEAFRRRRRTRAIVVISLVLVAAAAAWWWSAGR